MNAQDWHLLHKNRRRKIPLYEWIMHVGIQNVVVTPLEKVSTWSTDAREIFWMHGFGPANLLNGSIPDLWQEKWPWLMRTKSFAKTHTKTTSATTRVTAHATNFIQSRHTKMDFQDTIWLVLNTKKLCAPGVASQVLSKAKDKLRSYHNIFLRSQTTTRVSMASPPLKKHVLSVFENAVKRVSNISWALIQYLCSTFRVVSKSLPKAGQFCQSYRPKISTAGMRDYAQIPPPCSCANLHAQYGVPIVE